ncbi:MAG: thrombospondin type 3 repeat-containing protein [Dehalococcoidales bacterium]
MKAWIIAGIVLTVSSLFADESAKKQLPDETDSYLVTSWGQLYDEYISFRNQHGKIVPPSVSYEDAITGFFKNDWSFLSRNWHFTFSGGTRYTSALPTMGITEPVIIRIFENLRTADIIILSSPLTDGKAFNGSAIFTAPAFMPYEESFSLSRYSFDEMAPRRVLLELIVKPESYRTADLLAARAEAEAAALRMAAMPKSAPVPKTGIWMEFDFGASAINVHASTGYEKQIEIYSRFSLTNGDWAYSANRVANLTSNNPAAVVVDLSGTQGFFLAGDAEMDSDGDGIPDAREIYIHGTNRYLADSDGDGISDYDEIYLYRTDPLNNDVTMPAIVLMPSKNTIIFP